MDSSLDRQKNPVLNLPINYFRKVDDHISFFLSFSSLNPIILDVILPRSRHIWDENGYWSTLLIYMLHVMERNASFRRGLRMHTRQVYESAFGRDWNYKKRIIAGLAGLSIEW
jgi:hypothetical protein